MAEQTSFLRYLLRGGLTANHQGIFWGLTEPTTIYNNGETGYKTTHQSDSALHIRDIATNTNQVTYNPHFAPNDQVWHRYKIVQYWNSVTERFIFRVYLDGTLIFNVPQGTFNNPPQQPTYYGFINYTGEAYFNNWSYQEISDDKSLLAILGEDLFAEVGHTHSYDNYNGWDLLTDDTSRGKNIFWRERKLQGWYKHYTWI